MSDSDGFGYGLKQLLDHILSSRGLEYNVTDAEDTLEVLTVGRGSEVCWCSAVLCNEAWSDVSALLRLTGV